MVYNNPQKNRDLHLNSKSSQDMVILFIMDCIAVH